MNQNRSLFAALLAPLLLFASTPRVRTVSDFRDFSRAELKNIAVLAKGCFTLGCGQKLLLDSGDPYIWSAVCDRQGRIYLGTGNDGRIYRVTDQGDSLLFFDAPEMEVYALAMDRQDNLYAATSPNGKVYKIDPQGQSRVFFDPGENYIWALAWDSHQRLLVATGDQAAIYRVQSDGRAERVVALAETHVRCLAVDRNNTIYAGSGGKGFVYRIESGKPAFLLFDTQLEEVHSIAIMPSGTIMAAAYGESVSSRPEPLPSPTRSRTIKSAETNEAPSAETALSAMSFIMEAPLSEEVETSLFRIDSDGYGKNIWLKPDEQIQSLAVDENGGVLAGVGRKGKLYRVLESGESSLLLSTDGGQVSTIAFLPDRRLVIAASNPGCCWLADKKGAMQGNYESESIDAGMISTWGVLSWQGRQGRGAVHFSTRSGNAENPSSSWSEWQPVQQQAGVSRIASPAARFLQWQCVLQGQGEPAPEVDEVSISYLQNNRPPEVLAVMVYPQNEYYSSGESAADKPEKSGVVYAASLGKSEKKKGWRTAHWLFEDANMDGLSFSLYYRREGDSQWFELAKEVFSNIYPWDCTQMADGPYRLQVRATDRPTVPDELALMACKESDVFIIDNAGPEIEFKPAANRQVLCRVQDQGHIITAIEYSLNSSGWKKIYPTDGICDAKQEEVRIQLPRELSGQIQVAVKAVDEAGNYRTAYTITKASE